MVGDKSEVIGRWAARPIDDNLDELEAAAVVRLAASRPLLECRCGDELATIRKDERFANIDFLPVRRNGEIVGVLAQQELGDDADGRVSDVMAPLTSSMMVAGDAPLVDVLIAMEAEPHFRLVLDGSRPEAIITLSDLQKLPVASAIFVRVANLELLLNDALRSKASNDDEFLRAVGSKRDATEIRKWFARARKAGVEIDLIQAASFPAKLRAAAALEILNADDDRNARFVALRNDVAHQNEYACTRERAHRVIRTVRELREVVEQVRRFLRPKAPK